MQWDILYWHKLHEDPLTVFVSFYTSVSRWNFKFPCARISMMELAWGRGGRGRRNTAETPVSFIPRCIYSLLTRHAPCNTGWCQSKLSSDFRVVNTRGNQCFMPQSEPRQSASWAHMLPKSPRKVSPTSALTPSNLQNHGQAASETPQSPDQEQVSYERSRS